MTNNVNRDEFSGFSSSLPALPMPAELFDIAIPKIDDVAELLVTIYALASIQRLRRYPRFLDIANLNANHFLIEALKKLVPHDDVDIAFRRGVERSVKHGVLLKVDHGTSGVDLQSWLVLNSESDRRALERFQLNEMQPSGENLNFSSQPHGQKNVFTLYEETIGPITPQIAEALTEAEAIYPNDWFVAAFREAAELNKRSWRYTQRILQRWHNEGRDDEATRRHSRWKPDPHYEHLIQR